MLSGHAGASGPSSAASTDRVRLSSLSFSFFRCRKALALPKLMGGPAVLQPFRSRCIGFGKYSTVTFLERIIRSPLVLECSDCLSFQMEKTPSYVIDFLELKLTSNVVYHRYV